MSRDTIVTLGETMILLYPSDPGVPLAEARLLTMDAAGADTNFAIAMTRLGWQTRWVSRVGDDPFGQFLLNAIAKEGVDVSQVKRDGRYPTGVYFKDRSEASETRVFYYRRGSAASRLAPEDLDPDQFLGARLLHLNGMTCALSKSCERAVRRAIRLAGVQRAMISLDLNLRLSMAISKSPVLAN